MNKPLILNSIQPPFQKAVAPSNRPKASKAKEGTRPFPIRFTETELAYLRERAGNRPVGTYIRNQVLGSSAQDRRKQRQPRLNEKEYAALLAALGQSRLSSNLNQLARAANIGVLDVSPEVEQQLEYAYRAVLAMREALFTALGLKSK
jgi:hypothetical protein